MSAGKSPAAGILLFLTVLFVLALAGGAGYEQVERTRDRERDPPIGRSVDIGGRMLAIDCSGAGSPTVVFEAGAYWPLDRPREAYQNGAPRPGYGWLLAQREVAGFTQACWYDRAGAGWSDPGPYPRTAGAAARDLDALLRAAALAPPYVLVAEASAALDARVFTGLHPERVAGVVLVDGIHPDLFSTAPSARRTMPRIPQFVGYSQNALAVVFNNLGLNRLSQRQPAPAPPPGFTAAQWNTIWTLSQSGKARTALMQEIGPWDQSTAEARAAGSLGSRPLAVLSSDGGIVAPENRQSLWELEEDLARLSSRGVHLAVHAPAPLSYYAPAAIAGAVRDVVGQIRRQRP
ncbi:MAG: hypothetical protein LAP40_26150 [Acidobacteriia bacterium]|nr:hypothetical protein [Terriglobia bacterium]